MRTEHAIGFIILHKLIGAIPAWLIIVLSVFGTVLIARLFFSKEKPLPDFLRAVNR